MLLSEFLQSHTPLTAVDLLPDQRLINVVIGDGALYGVEVDNIPPDTTIMREAATLAGDIITSVTGLTFDVTQYTMLDSVVAAL